jgi:hypothetical protein
LNYFVRQPKWLACLAMLWLSVALCSAQKMEHNAFLNKPVFSTAELNREVGSDPTVLARYVRHFMMDKDKLKKYFTSLRIRPLKETRRYLVFNVDKKLVVRRRMLVMRKGTLVFTDKKGKPILKRSCGNPMVEALPAVGTTASHFAPAKRQDAEVKQSDDEAITMTDSPDSIRNTLIAPSELETTLEDPEVLPSPVAPLPPPPVGFTPFNPWPGLGVATGIAILVPPHDPGPAPVPEPISIFSFAAGLGGFALRRRTLRARGKA